MKVSIVNNRKMLRLSITGCIAALLLAIARFNGDTFFDTVLYLATEIIFIFLIMYLIAILQYVNEGISVQNPFSIMLGLEVIQLIGKLFFPRQTADLVMGISIITTIIIIYIIIAAFKVKTKKLALPFRILGIAWFLSSASKLSLLFFLSRMSGHVLMLCVDLINLIPLVAIYHIIRQAGTLLPKTESSNRVPI